MSVSVPLSILDLAHIAEDTTIRETLDASVAMARSAEELGYQRVWYAEHHNMSTIASSATSVLIGHIANHTSRIRLGAGGVMLPNHAPLTIAEQFGTLETLHPDRIDLGLGRAPGSDQNTMRALRRDPSAADSFPQDVQELQGYLTGNTRIPGVQAIPGRGTGVPLYILGSSLFGAKLAAALGLPYSFASHFAPNALEEAVAAYRSEFTPSEQLSRPHVIAGVNVTAADTTEEARSQAHIARRRRVAQLLGRGRTLTTEEAEAAMASPAGQQVLQMVQYSAVGDQREVADYLDWFAKHADADELIVAFQAEDRQARLHSLALTADAVGLEGRG
ncbi:luciferase family oxidoreductase group 1 [Haloactinospora alba]|uniref:Luciferase family oxidoreductase group 1 n=1 Tax=Haloactinospora alba TaxID=405555 RepID=A0A543N9K0_9ACTN|nr:LLM class flavin-dependent oxidoreductase [Haloactinospora alba]TQN28481.1 luciferase family oxidoreductase group 1 [Haloactinospora alba]